MEREIIGNEIKKEVQKKIIELSSFKKNNKATEEEFLNVIKTIAPGTNLRTALEGIVKIGKGALIVVENEYINDIIDGGFKVNCRFTPQRLMELSKMDGALILSRDLKKIIYANVLLTPDSKIPTVETGTRHKAAERTAKMTHTLVIAVSERKNEITVYFKNIRHKLVDSSDLLRKTNEQIQILEKQRELFDQNVHLLTKLELQNYHSLEHAIKVIQKGGLIMKIVENMNKYLIELGKEGSLIRARVKELMQDVERETDLVMKDYTKIDLKKSRTILKTLSYEELLDKNNILKVLMYEQPIQHKQIKGWRILNKTSLKEAEIALLIKESLTLGKAINSNITYYKSIFGEDKAIKLKEEIERMKINYSF